MPEISIKQGYKTYYLNWEIIHQDKRCMRIKVTPVSNPDKLILLENNEPLIRGKYKLKSRVINWKWIGGVEKSKNTLEMIIEAIVNPPEPKCRLTIPALRATGNKQKKGGQLGLPLGERNKGK